MLNPPGGSTRRSSWCLAGIAHHDIKLTHQNMAESYARLMQVLPNENQNLATMRKKQIKYSLHSWHRRSCRQASCVELSLQPVLCPEHPRWHHTVCSGDVPHLPVQCHKQNAEQNASETMQNSVQKIWFNGTGLFHWLNKGPFAKHLEHVLGSQTSVPEVGEPRILPKFQSQALGHHVAQGISIRGCLLVLEDDISRHLRPSKQRAMQQHPLQQASRHGVNHMWHLKIT